MIAYEQACELVLQHARPVGARRVPADRSCGMVLAEPVTARIASPPFDKAAMDGYAVRRADVAELPAELEVVGEVYAGQFPDFEVGGGQAAVITTGAPVPPGADMVVMVEHTEEVAGDRVRVEQLSGDNVCLAGEDVAAGETVLNPGAVMTPLRIGVAGAAGRQELSVHRRPTGALLCTGSEVVEPGERPGRGQIFNANGPMLRSLMRPRCGGFSYLGIAGDERESLESSVREGLRAEVLVISGGVSMGEYDLVPPTLECCGVERVFHKVAVKPGKPTYFGCADGTLVFGMPGNPQSCFVIFNLLVAPALAAMAGHAELPPRLETGRMGEGFENKPERMNVKPCSIERGPDGPLLRRQPYHGSADIVGPARADGYFIVPRGTEYVEEGRELEFFTI
ncbi:MAG: gephyrin-like molybdotransferase Glp [Planctomycetota bacterium]